MTIANRCSWLRVISLAEQPIDNFEERQNIKLAVVSWHHNKGMLLFPWRILVHFVLNALFPREFFRAPMLKSTGEAYMWTQPSYTSKPFPPCPIETSNQFHSTRSMWWTLMTSLRHSRVWIPSSTKSLACQSGFKANQSFKDFITTKEHFDWGKPRKAVPCVWHLTWDVKLVCCCWKFVATQTHEKFCTSKTSVGVF